MNLPSKSKKLMNVLIGFHAKHHAVRTNISFDDLFKDFLSNNPSHDENNETYLKNCSSTNHFFYVKPQSK